MTQQLEQQPAVTGKKKRGRESAGDMVRSLSLVLIIVFVAFFLAQPPDSDEKELRQVDPTADIASFAQAHPGVPVPLALPSGWRSNVTELTADLLRVGWVTPENEYAEYAASTGPAGEFLRVITDSAPEVEPVDIGGVQWKQYRSGNAISLVRSTGGATIVLGTRRASASLDELRVLASVLAGSPAG